MPEVRQPELALSCQGAHVMVPRVRLGRHNPRRGSCCQQPMKLLKYLSLVAFVLAAFTVGALLGFSGDLVIGILVKL